MKTVFVVCIKQNHMADFLKVKTTRAKAEEYIQNYKKNYPMFLAGGEVELVIYEELLD